MAGEHLNRNITEDGSFGGFPSLWADSTWRGYQTNLPAQPSPYEDFIYSRSDRRPQPSVISDHQSMNSPHLINLIRSPPSLPSGLAESPLLSWPPDGYPSPPTYSSPRISNDMHLNISLSTSEMSLAPQPTDHNALLDSSESAMLSSFLHTMEVDTSFLFNPILPPGMPSPPPSLGVYDGESPPLVGFNNLGLDTQQTQSIHTAPALQTRLDRIESDLSSTMTALPETFETTRPLLKAGERDESFGERHGKKQKFDSQSKAEPSENSLGHTAIRKRAARRPKASATRGRNLSEEYQDENGEEEEEEEEEEENYESASSPEYSAKTLATSALLTDKRAPLTEKQKRSNHILSEQKRRNAIREGFRDLVELVTRGEQASGIRIAPEDPNQVEDEMESRKGKLRKKGKTTGRGRGRKGEVGAGASKSVVLEKAAQYILWLELGNEGIKKEIERLGYA